MTSWDEMGDVGHQLLQLRNDVEDLVTAVEYLPVRFGGLDSQVEDLKRSLRTAEAKAAEANTTIRDLAALIKRLDARVEWLERNIRLRDAMPMVELDDVPADLRLLAAQAEAGHVAVAELLSAEQRSGLEAKVSAHADAVRARMRHLSAALSASRALANTPWTTADHQQATAEFTSSVTALDEAGQRIRELAQDALAAAEELASDESRQVARADVIAAGERAWEALDDALRRRVADAVGEGALLPAWFTRVLGPIPPAEDTRTWMEVATALLAYRVTYGITDPIAGLGPDPADGDGRYRRIWHHQLRRQLRDLQR